MAIRGKIKRLGLLIEHIKQSHYPSKQELLNFLSDEGFETSLRTIDRDIEAIRDEFWLEIVYDRFENGYFINDFESNHTSTLLKLFNLINTTDILVDSLKQGRKAIENIEFDGSENLKGINLLPILLKAIQNSKQIEFFYQSFYALENRKINLKPLFLKEYSKRWYVIGYNDYLKDYRTYGIDRMQKLETLSENFSADQYGQAKQLFRNTVGITLSPEEPALIRVLFTKEQAEYIKALPLHHTQEVESETSDKVIITYYVSANFEFKQKLLMQMDNAIILEPKSLAENIRDIAKAIVANYDNKSVG